MGFLDKAKDAAKRLDIDKAKAAAKQAQQKLDEVQTSFNEGQAKRAGGQPGPAPAQYDKHGRPIPQEPAAAAPAAPPVSQAAPPDIAPPDPAPGPAASVPPPVAPVAPPPASGEAEGLAVVEEDVAHGEHSAPPGPPPSESMDPPRPDDPNEPPRMTSGDPLAP